MASDLSVVRTEFRETLDALGLAQHRIAHLFGVGPRSVRRWQNGDRRVPCGVDILLRLMACGAVSIDEVERVAVAIPARTNGGAEPEPPAPLPAAPALEQSAATGAEVAALADPELTTAEAIVALAPGACRWPHGDPGCAGFRFCGSPVARQPYCEIHHALACAAPRTGSGQDASRGLVSHGWRSDTGAPHQAQDQLHQPIRITD